MIPLATPNKAVDGELLSRVAAVLEGGRYILGDETKGLESEFAAFCGAKEAVAVSSGTAALHLTLLAAGIKGKEVITTPHTFIATANAIVHAGGTPVFADVDAETGNIDPSKIESKITDKTVAILPVHLYGHPADMDPILEIASANDLDVFEDACQAHGAEYKNKKIGAIGRAACFSFFPSKVMTVAGDGGIVTTDDSGLAEQISMLRNQGRAAGKKYEHDLIGFNYRISEVASAVGRFQLEKLPKWLTARRRVAEYYNKNLSGQVKIPVQKEYAKSAYYVYTFTTDRRDELFDHLRKNEIGAGIYYPVPVHLQPAYKDYGCKKGDFPVTEDFASKILSIPMHPYLTGEELKTVTSVIKGFFA